MRNFVLTTSSRLSIRQSQGKYWARNFHYLLKLAGDHHQLCRHFKLPTSSIIGLVCFMTIEKLTLVLTIKTQMAV